jgi:purine-binding chemotaxis protein CheW
MRDERPRKKEDRHILVFRSGSQEFGLDISCVREVLRLQEVCPLPRTPDFIEGVINLRGQIIALVDLAKKLNGKIREEESKKRIIVCRVNGSIVGLLVAGLREMIALPEDEIAPTPEVVAMDLETNVLSGIARMEGRIIPILNLGHILTKKEAAELAKLGEG